MLIIDVPLNTMLADLDETLRGLVREELERHGFEGVDIAFDAPSRDWSGRLSKPTVNLFLYDLCEAESLRSSEWSRVKKDGAHARVAPADRLLGRTPDGREAGARMDVPGAGVELVTA